MSPSSHDKPVPSLETDPLVKKGETIELIIQDAGERDACFAQMPSGMGVWVRGSVAVGDRVAATVTKLKRNFVVARLDRIVVPSPVRATPVCKHFGTCGGCTWQHVGYDEQLRIKKKRVRDALTHLGGFKDLEMLPILEADNPFHYRNKIEFSFARDSLLDPRGTITRSCVA